MTERPMSLSAEQFRSESTRMLQEYARIRASISDLGDNYDNADGYFDQLMEEMNGVFEDLIELCKMAIHDTNRYTATRAIVEIMHAKDEGGDLILHEQTQIIMLGEIMKVEEYEDVEVVRSVREETAQL